MPEPQPAVDTQKRTPCNLVMKGAIVSGVVYPSVIIHLKDYHDFRKIGGTSAGAIAAAAAAAAEYRRQKAIGEGDVAHQDDGFKYMQDQLSSTLAQPGFLLNLFQPTKETRPLLDILSPLLALLQQNKPRDDALPLLPILQTIQCLRPQLPQSGLRFVSDVLRQWEGDEYSAFAQGKSQGGMWGRVVGAILGVLLALALTGLIALFGPYERWALVGVLLLSLVAFGYIVWWLARSLEMRERAIGSFLGVLLVFMFTALFALFAPEHLVLGIMMLACTLLFTGIGAWFGGWLGTWFVGISRAVIGLSDLLTDKVFNNFFGVCIGYNPARKDDLTSWLHTIYSEMAGLPEKQPLTFGDLHSQGIELRMVTSNLSHGRPYVMPEGLENFIWKEKDFQRFFPPEIIEHLKTHEDALPDVILPQEEENACHFFPKAENLPVLVAVRLSISFPLLLSAVPLYTISTDDMPVEVPLSGVIAPGRLQKNWFSDGGICSNLPIQFFDEWLPSYPTLGINLTSLRPVKVDPTQLSILPRNPLQLFASQIYSQELPPSQQDGQQQEQSNRQDQRNKALPLMQQPQQQQQMSLAQSSQPVQIPAVYINDNPQVYLPKAGEPYTPEWVEQRDLFAFLNAILSTGLYHRELSQVGLPSYRERVVQIRLKPKQEGLNLDMDKATVDELMKNGATAGVLLTDSAQGFNFEQYQWVRLLVFMSQFESNLNEIKKQAEDIESYRQILETTQAHPRAFPFPQKETWYEGTANNLQKLLKLAREDWQYVEDADPFARDRSHLSFQDSIVLQVVPAC